MINFLSELLEFSLKILISLILLIGFLPFLIVWSPFILLGYLKERNQEIESKQRRTKYLEEFMEQYNLDVLDQELN